MTDNKVIGISFTLWGLALAGIVFGSHVSAQVEVVPHAPYAKTCFYSDYDAKKVYQIGDRVSYGNTCVIDGDQFALSISNINKGHDPSDHFNSEWYWHYSCGICGPDTITSLLYEYEKLRDENTKLKAQLKQCK